MATASRALAGRDEVSPGTRRAVEDASRRLGYRRDGVAAALRTRTTGAIGIVVPQIADWFYPPMVASVEHELAKRQIGLLVGSSRDDVTLEADRLETLLRRRVDGLIVCPVDARGSAPALRSASRQVPTMQIDRHAVDDLDFVGIDEAQGMAQIAQHIRAMGAETAIFIGSDPAVSSAQERADSFAAAAKVEGITLLDTVDVLDLEWQTDFTAGQLFAERALEQQLADAIVCVNDLLAFGVLSGLRAHGVRCPEDVLITGCNDDVPMAELMGLTTIRTPMAEIGREATRLLLSDGRVPRHVRLRPTLVVRETTRRTRNRADEENGARLTTPDATAVG